MKPLTLGAGHSSIKSAIAFYFSTDDLTHIEQSGLVATPRIKKLITELKQCVYIEASAQTGENVDLVFNTGNSGYQFNHCVFLSVT